VIIHLDRLIVRNPNGFLSRIQIGKGLSEKVCAVCGKALLPKEIRISELRRRSTLKKTRYLCSRCRRREYEEYVKAVKDLIKKS